MRSTATANTTTAAAAAADGSPPPPYGSIQGGNQYQLVPPSNTKQHRPKSPVGSAIRSLFGLPQSSTPSKPSSGIVRHGSLRNDPRKFSFNSSPLVDGLPPSYSSGTDTKCTNTFGGDLLQRAGKKLSASSSSLTNKFKFISSATKHSPSDIQKMGMKDSSIGVSKVTLFCSF